MSFALPFAFVLSAVALPIIGLYILKVRLRRVPVSTNLFWKQVYDEKPPRSLWQHLRHLISLLAQLLVLALLVLAVADPYFSWQMQEARRLIIVLDTSASMTATDVLPSRFAAAKTAAQQVLDGLRARDQAAVVAAGSRPEVIMGMAAHLPTLRRAVDSVQPSQGTSSVESAIELGRQLIGDHPHGQILIFTDGCAERPDDGITTTSLASPSPTDSAGESQDISAPLAEASSVPAPGLVAPGAVAPQQSEVADQQETIDTVDVQYRVFATEASNLGITQFQTRRSLDDPVGYEILVSVFNASTRPAKARLELELEGVPIDVIPLNLKPEESWTRTIEKVSLDGGLLKASLSRIEIQGDGSAPLPGADSQRTIDAASVDAVSVDVQPVASKKLSTESVAEIVIGNSNGLATDDIAWAVVPRRIVQKVLIVSPGNLFLQKVFEAIPLVSVSTSRELPSEWPQDTIVVCHRLIPDRLPAGSVLVVDPETGSDCWDIGDAIENPIVTEQDKTSPLMTHIRMDNVLMPEARRLTFKFPVSSLAATLSGESVYTALQRPEGKCLVLSVNLERSDLAFRTVFPILISNALNWFGGQPGELQPSIAAGQMTSVTLPESGAAQLVSPSRQTSPLLSGQAGPFNEVGVWVVRHTPAADAGSEASVQASPETSVETSGTETLQEIAVNLSSASETNLRPVKELTEGQQNPALAGVWFTRPVWFYLALAASLFSTMEWFLYQRRFIT